ncbi:MAG: peroxiredoxin [Proteobacteria bacterium]|nr:peroxiredoxin [Pseudomonadota bacterium]
MAVEGKKLGSFTLKATGGKEYSFPRDFAERLTLFYFYPKDNTPGCTRQACSYRDHYQSFKDCNVQVLGVSKDDMSSHEAFVEKYQLTFPLVVDTDRSLAKELEVTGRDSFLVNGEGRVVAEWRNVSPDTTVEKTLETAKAFLTNNLTS